MNVKAHCRLAISNYLSGDDETVDLSFSVSQSDNYIDGTDSGEANEAWNDTRSLGSGANEDLDLAGGVSRGGYAYTFTKIKAILIQASIANTTNVGVKSAAVNGFGGPWADPSDITEIPPGGLAFYVHPTDGWIVTAATGDLLNIADGGAAGVVYTITLIGVGSVA